MEICAGWPSQVKNSKVHNISRGPDGNAFIVSFELDGQEFMGLNAGPHFKFNEAVSMYVDCEDQAEVDYFWKRKVILDKMNAYSKINTPMRI